MPVQAQTIQTATEPRILPPAPKRKAKPRRRAECPLTAKQQAFVNAVFSGVDRVTAAKQAGYSQLHIDVTAYKLTRTPRIALALKQLAAAAINANSIDSAYVIKGIKEEIEHLKSNPDRSPAASQAIFRGTELLGKTIALFTDKTQEDKHITITIERVG